MSRQSKQLLAWVAGLAFTALVLTPLLVRGISPVTQGVMIGVAGAACLVAIGLGAWNAVRGERKRRAKEDIWINH